MKTIFVFLLLLPHIVLSQWVQISTIGNNELRSVKFLNEFTGVTVGQGGIWRSTNSGINWLQLLSGPSMNSLSFADNSIGYAVGDSGKIYKTTNSGLNWNQIGIGLTTKKLNGVSFPAPNTGWIMGESGKILYTFNGGASFSDQTSGSTTYDINFLQMVNTTTGYFCGSSNSNAETFGYSPNGGINWLYALNVNGNVLNSLCFIPTSNGNVVAVGTNGRIRKTTSNGTTWVIVTSPTNMQLNHIYFLDVNTGYVSGNSGTILKTINSGLNWTIEPTVTSSNINCISFINPNTGWVVGSNGIVLRTGIPVSIEGQIELSKNFILEQNYPNPFNPSTSISFEIPKNGFVKLSVYDLLGNEIETLVHKNLILGKYEIFFNTNNMPSGVYIYKLEVNTDFSASKKMVLIK